MPCSLRRFVADLRPMEQRPLTVVLGASPKPWRYAHMAVRRLLAHGHRVHAVGLREGHIEGTAIHTDVSEGAGVDTVTVYLGSRNLASWTDRLLAMHPRRIVFNPGAEDAAFAARARAKGIEVVEGCTLVMLAAGTY